MSQGVHAPGATVVDLLERSSAVMVDEHGTERSCGDILRAGRLLAQDLGAHGLLRGDRIAVQMPNGPRYLDLLVAAAVGGFVVMSVNLRFGDGLANSIIERSGARLTVRSQSDLPPELSAPESSAVIPPPGSTPDDRFVIFTTSGTTSAPKLVVHQHRSIVDHAVDVATAFGYTQSSVVLLPLPLSGVFGFTTFWAAVAGNATVVLPQAFHAEETGRLIEHHRVTSMHGSDDMFHRLLDTEHDLSSIQQAGYARFNSALDGIVERCETRGVPLAGLYGMSEVQALYSFRGAPGRAIAERWKAGGNLVSPGADRRVVEGELQLRGPSLFEGYLADGGAEIDRELTAANFDDGWFKTGDLAVEDGPRSFEYVARIGDVMRLGGYLVAPTEIEATIMTLDEIAQAQVVAVDREQGARPVAFVILEPDAQLDEQAVIDHCAATLARFKCPVRVVAVDEFPTTNGPNGVKIQRAKLRIMGADLML